MNGGQTLLMPDVFGDLDLAEVLHRDAVRRVWAPWLVFDVLTYRIGHVSEDTGKIYYHYATRAMRGQRTLLAAFPAVRDRADSFAHPQMRRWARWGWWPGGGRSGWWGTRCVCRHSVLGHGKDVGWGLREACQWCACGAYRRRLLTTGYANRLVARVRGRKPWVFEMQLEEHGLAAEANLRWYGTARTRAGMCWAWWRQRRRYAQREGVMVWPSYPKGR